MIVVTSASAVEAFRRMFRDVVAAPVVDLAPLDIDVEAVERAVGASDLVIFVSGRSAYRLREVGVRLVLDGKVVATAEGDKGAVMVENAFGVKPQLVFQSVEDLAEAVSKCKSAVVFHHGESAEALVDKLRQLCRVYQFYTYRAVPRWDVVNALPAGGIYVFFSGVAAEIVAREKREVLEKSIVVAAGPAVARALHKYGINALTPPRGRIIDVIDLVKKIYF